MPAHWTRIGPWVNVLGVTLLLIGLVFDLALHRRDPGLLAREGASPLANPAHLLAGAGLALILAAALIFLLSRAFGHRSHGRLARAAMLTLVACLVALGAIGLATAAVPDHPGPAHDHAGQPLAPLAQAASPHARRPAATGQVQPDPAASQALLAASRAGVARFDDFAVAQAEGYDEFRLAGIPGRAFWPSHYVNRSYVLDGRALDPERPEALMYLNLPGRPRKLVGVMYLVGRQHSLTPEQASLPWHTHHRLCFAAGGLIGGLAGPDGRCPAGTSSPPVQPRMLHVWLFDNPDGPYAQHLTRASIRAAYRQSWP